MSPVPVPVSGVPGDPSVRETVAQAIHDGPNAQAQYVEAGIAGHSWVNCPFKPQYLADADAVLAVLNVPGLVARITELEAERSALIEAANDHRHMAARYFDRNAQALIERDEARAQIAAALAHAQGSPGSSLMREQAALLASPGAVPEFVDPEPTAPESWRCSACGHWCNSDGTGGWICSKRGGCGNEYPSDWPGVDPAAEYEADQNR